MSYHPAQAQNQSRVVFILTGVGIIVRSLNTKDSRLLPYGLFHSLSVSFYHSPRIFVPLLLISMFSLIWKSNKTYSKEFKRTGLLYGIAVFFVSFLLIFVVKEVRVGLIR